MDAPTWSWARNRAEPFFGQDHAAAAALLLLQVGDHEAAAAAGVWSTTVDGWRPEVGAVVQQALLRSKANDAAAAFAAIRARRFAGDATTGDALLAANAPQARALLAALAQHADALRGSGQPTAAATLAAEHGRLAALLAASASSSPESSGTGFLVFGTAWGVQSGVLARADYEAVIRAGWAALHAAVDADGRVGFVQQVGDRPESALASDSQFYGSAAFVMAAIAVHDLGWR
jgi:hypothetical protein